MEYNFFGKYVCLDIETMWTDFSNHILNMSSDSEKSYYSKTCEVYSKCMGYVSWKKIKRYFQGKVKRTRFHKLLCIAMNILTHKCTKEIKYAILLTTEARSEYKCNFEAD